MIASHKKEFADPILYRIYFSLMCKDILFELGFNATQENKAILHEFHKRILGYKTIAGMPQIIVSEFLLEVTIFWATNFGIFVRTSRKQPKGIEWLPLSKIKHLL
jgi:hypothetical protein